MQQALRTSVCANCREVLVEVQFGGVLSMWLHEDPARLQHGAVLNVNDCIRLFDSQTLLHVQDQLRRSDTNRPTAIYWMDGEHPQPRVLPALCGPSYVAVPHLDAARNLIGDCARCGEPVTSQRLSRREAKIVHTDDLSPYCRATPIPDALDAN